MNHSLQIIMQYVCEYYGLTPDLVKSASREGELVKARNMIHLLAGPGKERIVGRLINRDRTTMITNRKTFIGNMRFDRNLKAEFETLKKGLLQYELCPEL